MSLCPLTLFSLRRFRPASTADSPPLRTSTRFGYKNPVSSGRDHVLVTLRRTFSAPSSSSGKLFEYATELMYTACLSLYFSMSIVGRRVTASVPPGARISQPCSCVPPAEIASKTNSIGELVIFLTSAATSALRSMTCVAPSDLTRSELDNDAVTMIGEKPERFANCIAVYT